MKIGVAGFVEQARSLVKYLPITAANNTKDSKLVFPYLDALYPDVTTLREAGAASVTLGTGERANKTYNEDVAYQNGLSLHLASPLVNATGLFAYPRVRLATGNFHDVVLELYDEDGAFVDLAKVRGEGTSRSLHPEPKVRSWRLDSNISFATTACAALLDRAIQSGELKQTVQDYYIGPHFLVKGSGKGMLDNLSYFKKNPSNRADGTAHSKASTSTATDAPANPDHDDVPDWDECYVFDMRKSRNQDIVTRARGFYEGNALTGKRKHSRKGN